MTTRMLLALVAAQAVVATPVLADPAPSPSPPPPPASPMAEAGQHFDRGVSLYDEADYRAALIEFKRAYEIAPNAVVLYNIGEAYYQLQNYASALTALERYMAEAPETAEHRAEVTKTLAILKTRVGKVQITTNVPGCEITIDDEFVGTSPLAQPVPISIGRRKITAMRAGLPPDTRIIEVAAGDTMQAQLTLVKPAPAVSFDARQAATADADRHGAWVTAGWITTGVLGVGGIAAGVVAFKESRDLKDERDTFGVTHDELTHKASLVTTYSAIGDIAGGLAIIAGVVSLKLTLSHTESHEIHAALAPNGIVVAGTFH